MGFHHDLQSEKSLQRDENLNVFGLFNKNHINYIANRNADEPTLTEMTLKAIELLSQNEDGFVLFVEGGRIDHGNMVKIYFILT